MHTRGRLKCVESVVTWQFKQTYIAAYICALLLATWTAHNVSEDATNPMLLHSIN